MAVSQRQEGMFFLKAFSWLETAEVPHFMQEIQMWTVSPVVMCLGTIALGTFAFSSKGSQCDGFNFSWRADASDFAQRTLEDMDGEWAVGLVQHYSYIMQ